MDFSEDVWNDADDGETNFFASSPEQRIVEALQTCPWSNMEQGKPEKSSSKDEKSSESESQSKESKKQDPEEEEEDFEALFAKFAQFKEKAGSLKSDESRRDYAEKVTMSFWKALGGDPSELDGIDSD